MKKLITLLLVLLICGWINKSNAQCIMDVSPDKTIICGESTQLSIQANWVKMDSVTSNHLSSIYFTNETTGYAVGDSGTILKTTNQGITFIAQSSGTTNYLRSVKFPQANIGYAVGFQGTVLKTVNGGSNWVAQVSNTSNDLQEVFFINSQIGYAVGSSGTIVKTNDGGLNWLNLTSGVTWGLNTVFFTDSLNGYVGGYGGGIIITNNGGLTWSQKFYFSNCNINSIWFTSAQVGYASGAGGIGFMLKTIDSGNTWNTLISGIGNGKLFFSNANTAYLASGAIYKTNDAFNNWNQLNNGPFIGMRSVYFPTENVGYAAGFGGAIFKYLSPDSVRWWPALGLNDSTLANPTATPAISTTYFVSAKVNGCVLTNTITLTVNPLTLNAGKVKSVNCGDTTQLNAIVNYTGSNPLKFKWSPADGLSNDTLQNPTCMLQGNKTYYLKAWSNNGCIAFDTLNIFQNFSVKLGSDQTIYCSKGTQLSINAEWIKTNSGTVEAFKSMKFVSTDTGFIVTQNNLFITVNGGATWTSKPIGGSYMANKIFFRNSKLGYVATFSNINMQGVVLKTTNGGNSFTALNMGGNYQIPAVWFTSDQVGYAGANPGKILRTINGGTSWLSSPTGTTNGINNIFFVNASIGYAVGSIGTILKTTNAGLSWTIQNSTSSFELNAVYFVSPDTGYVAGSNNTFLKTNNGGISWESSPINTSSQVYYNLNDLVFTDNQTGYLAANYSFLYGPINQYGTIFKTFNGGSTWQRMQSDTSYPLKTISFNKSNMGFAAGENGTIQTSPVAADSYNWLPSYGLNANNIPNPIASPTVTTTYIVTGTKGNCQLSDSVTVNVLNLNIDAGKDKMTVCGEVPELKHNNVYLYIDASRYGSTWTIKDSNNKVVEQSSPDQITNKYINLPDGTYTYNGKAQVIPPPQTIRIIPFASDSISEYLMSSPTYNINRTFKVQTDPKYNFSWAPIPAIINPNSVTSKYYLTMSTMDGCFSRDSVLVQPAALTVNAGNNKTITCGSWALLDTLTTNYSGQPNLLFYYFPGKSLNDSLSKNPQAKPNDTAQYIVHASTLNGCIASDTVSIFVNPLTVISTDLRLPCNQTDTFKINSNYTGLDPLIYTWTPSINLDSSNKRNPIVRGLSKVNYQIKIETSNGCMAIDSAFLTLENPLPEQICMVGVTELNQNQIILNKRATNYIDTIFISRETNTTGNYQRIGALPNAQTLLFIDNNSNPKVQSNKYQINVKDICGLMSNPSAAHKTMHLTINKGTGNIWNLIWSNYEGFLVSTYNVYRGTDSSNLTLIGTSSGSNNTYTDLTAAAGDYFYQVEIISPNSCFPGKSYNSSRSNKANTKTVGLFEPSANWFDLFPNPAQNNINLVIDNMGNNLEMKIVNMQGIIQLKRIINQSRVTEDISFLAPGIYIIQLNDDKRVANKIFVKE